eukprot:g32709.t1
MKVDGTAVLSVQLGKRTNVRNSARQLLIYNANPGAERPLKDGVGHSESDSYEIASCEKLPRMVNVSDNMINGIVNMKIHLHKECAVVLPTNNDMHCICN